MYVNEGLAQFLVLHIPVDKRKQVRMFLITVFILEQNYFDTHSNYSKLN